MLKVIYINAQGKKKSIECVMLDAKVDNAECCVLTFLGEVVGTETKKRGKQTIKTPTHRVIARALGVTYYEIVEK